MLLVIDSNEYILALGPYKEKYPKLLLDVIVEKYPLHRIRIPRLTINEVRTNISPGLYQEFITFILSLTFIDEDFLIPFELGAKYEAKGLKPADALIAAYTEWSGADVLVTENRHFLSRHRAVPFKVLTAHNCYKLLTST